MGVQLQMLIKSEFPDAAVRVRPLAQSVYLSGYVPSPAMVNSIVRIAEDYYPKVVNNMTVGGVQQILLKTKVMEVSRTKLRQVGFDWSVVLDGQSRSSVGAERQRVGDAAAGVATGRDTVRFGIVDGNSAFYGFIDALRRNDLIKVLAEPQLTTVSGRAAPVPFGRRIPDHRPAKPGHGIDRVSVIWYASGLRPDRAGQRQPAAGSATLRSAKSTRRGAWSSTEPASRHCVRGGSTRRWR